MGGIQGPTSGAGGVDPRRIGDSADAQSRETSSLPDPSLPPVQPDIDPLRTGKAPGQHAAASFKSPVDTPDAGQAATTADRQTQKRLIEEEWSKLVSNLNDLGLSGDQIAQIVGSRRKTEGTVDILRQLQQFCNALRIDSHRTDQQVPVQLDQLPAQLAPLVKAGGANALDALTNAYSEQTEPPNIGELCELLEVLGTTFGHSFKQLAGISLDNADALPVLRHIHEELELLQSSRMSGVDHTDEMWDRAKMLGVLAQRGGVAALRALTNVALTGPSPSLRDFDPDLEEALRATGLKPREINRLQGLDANGYPILARQVRHSRDISE